MTTRHIALILLPVAAASAIWTAVPRSTAAPTAPTAPPAAPKPIDDVAWMKRISVGATRLTRSGKTTPGKTLVQQLSRKQCSFATVAPKAKTLSPEELYRQCRDSVLIIVSVSRRGNRFAASAAAAFVIGPDGQIVLNYHSVNQAAQATMVAVTYDGKMFPVKEILAADKAADVAIARIETGPVRLKPLPLSATAPIGAAASVISHPDQRFYYFSRGIVSRYERRHGADWMTITADYARGSSGAPVLDDRGAVIGVAAMTHSIYYENNKKANDRLQMVVKMCVPSASIQKLIRQP